MGRELRSSTSALNLKLQDFFVRRFDPICFTRRMWLTRQSFVSAAAAAQFAAARFDLEIGSVAIFGATKKRERMLRSRA
jgi:hypothetical protein